MGKSNSPIIEGFADIRQYYIMQREVEKDPRMLNLLPFCSPWGERQSEERESQLPPVHEES